MWRRFIVNALVAGSIHNHKNGDSGIVIGVLNRKVGNGMFYKVPSACSDLKGIYNILVFMSMLQNNLSNKLKRVKKNLSSLK